MRACDRPETVIERAVNSRDMGIKVLEDKRKPDDPMKVTFS
jgi:hypothetical protein